jgi:hypothetical protein
MCPPKSSPEQDRETFMRRMHLAIAVALLSLYGTPPSFAQASGPTPHVALQGADFYRFRVGAVTVTALSDGTVPQDLHALLRGTTPAKTNALLDTGFLSNLSRPRSTPS